MTADVVVVGAGAAGLVAARRLVPEHRVVVIDKARGVGGRMATRRLGPAVLDHGAQFITTHSAEFADEVARWEGLDVVRPWFRGRVGPSGVQEHDGHVRYRGTASMNAVAKHLAEGLDVRRTTRASTIEPCADGWRLTLESADELRADAVVVTAPVPQTLELLDRGGTTLDADVRAALQRIRYEPCLAVLLRLQDPVELPEPGAVAPDGGPIEWIADNVAKGISSAPALTLHARGQASVALWDESDERVVAELLSAARRELGQPLVVEQHSVQRWRYARPTVLHPDPCLVAAASPPLVVAGDAFGGPKVEGAVRSGAAAADSIRPLLARP